MTGNIAGSAYFLPHSHTLGHPMSFLPMSLKCCKPNPVYPCVLPRCPPPPPPTMSDPCARRHRENLRRERAARREARKAAEEAEGSEEGEATPGPGPSIGGPPGVGGGRGAHAPGWRCHFIR